MAIDLPVPGLDTLSQVLNLEVKDDKQTPSSDTNGQTNGHTEVNGTKKQDVNGHSNGETSGETNGETSGESESGTSPEKKEPDVPPGSIGAATTIYRTKDTDGQPNWTKDYPEDAVEAAENDETAKYAVVLRSQKSSDSRKKLEAHSIVVQSPELRAALSKILEDYPGISCELSRLIFEAPFKPFVHRWPDLLDFLDRKDLDKTTKDHLNILYGILKEELRDTIKAYEEYILHGVTTWEHAWMLFQPGSLIVSESLGPLSAYELIDAEYAETQCGVILRLRVDIVEWNGSEFGRHRKNLSIPEYKGVEKIADLAAFPLAFHENKEAVKAHLVERGKKFEALAGHHFKAYDGMAITWDQRGNEVAIHHKGRIVIDCKAFDQYSPYSRRGTREFNAKDKEILTKRNLQPRSRNPLKKDSTEEEVSAYVLSDYHRMLAHSRVRGYSLALKKWLDFYIHWVDEISWNTRAFDALVLPEDQKELILSFTESQVEHRKGFDDVVSGKGQGIIILLSGKPGIGKTLTAESVAEAMKRPLHTISSGDLGSNSWDIEEKLSEILELVGRWNAVLLLDECDVFLEARSTHDLERNAMVSVFLRVLEYYQGILFMTTNRADNIDQAFESRIHVSMQYPDLTSTSRRKIWNNFLKSHSHAFSEADLDELAEIDLNGRQIKNILKTSHLLASRKKNKLSMKEVSTVLDIEKRRPERVKK